MSEHPSHPWYGPCDALADGECAECRKLVEGLREQVKRVPGEIADWLAKQYPDNANTHAFCAAIRSLAVASDQRGTQ